MPKAELRGGSASKPFAITLKSGQQFAAVAVGYDRDDPKILTGLRFDISGAELDNGGREIFVVGSMLSRWAPLVDGFSAQLQPIGIFGRAEQGIRSLGFILNDKHRSPTFGRTSSGREFEITLEDSQSKHQRLVGFYGTMTERNLKKYVEDIGVIYGPVDGPIAK